MKGFSRSNNFPGKLTDLVKHTIIVWAMVIALSAIATFGYEPSNSYPSTSPMGIPAPSRCMELRDRYNERFLTDTERDDYCLHKCTFLAVRCISSNHYAFVMPKFDFTAVTEKFNELADDARSGDMKIFSEDGQVLVNERVMQVWVSMFNRMVGVLLSFIPVALSQLEKHHGLTGPLCLLVAVIMGLIGLFPPAISVHNVLISALCFVYRRNSSLPDHVWTIVFMVVPLAMSFISNTYVQIFILLAVMIGFIKYLQMLFYTRRSNAAVGIVVVVAQLVVLMDQLYFVKDQFILSSLGLYSIETVLFALYPVGESKWLVHNAFIIVAQVANLLPPVFSYHTWFAIVLSWQIFAFLAFRACLGAFYLHVLRYKFDAHSLVNGFIVYTTDSFGPLLCLYRVAVRAERFDSRRFMYAGIGFVLFLAEWIAAYEYALFRLFCSSLDIIVFRSHYGRAMHYLDFKVDFMQAAYPQDNAPSWMSLRDLTDICKTVDQLIADRGSTVVRGMAVMLKSSGRNMLYTVSHVVDRAKSVTFLKHGTHDPAFRRLTDGDDPMVAMKVEYPVEMDVPEVDLLSKAELDYVSHLAFINCSGEEKNICVVPDFTLVGEKLSVAINLKKGDSGGPCFAVLKDGSLRLCGVVSAGNPRSGGGNLIAFCFSHDVDLEHSSDEESVTSSTDHELVEGCHSFNIERGAPAMDMQRRYKLADRVHRYMQESKGDLIGMKDWSRHIKWDDLDKPTDEVAMTLFRGNFLSWVEAVRKKSDDDPYPDGNSSRSRAKRKKARHKDIAYRKRQLAHARVLREMLSACYSDDMAEAIFRCLMHGRVPTLAPGRDYLLDIKDGLVVMADQFEEFNW